MAMFLKRLNKDIGRFLREVKNPIVKCEISVMLHDLKESLDLDDRLIIALGQSINLAGINCSCDGTNRDYGYKNGELTFNDLEWKNNRFKEILEPISEYKDIDSIDVLMYRNHGSYSGMWFVMPGYVRFIGDDQGDGCSLSTAIRLDHSLNCVPGDKSYEGANVLAKALTMDLKDHIERQGFESMSEVLNLNKNKG